MALSYYGKGSLAVTGELDERFSGQNTNISDGYVSSCGESS